MTVNRRLRAGQSIEIEREQGVTDLTIGVEPTGKKVRKVNVEWVDSFGEVIESTGLRGVEQTTMPARTDKARITVGVETDLLVYAGWSEA